MTVPNKNDVNGVSRKRTILKTTDIIIINIIFISFI